MNNDWVSSKNERAKTASAKKAAPKRVPKMTTLDEQKFNERIIEIQEEIEEGLGKSAEETALHVRENHELTREQTAQVDAFHSQSLEIRGRYKEAYDLVESYIESRNRQGLSVNTDILVSNQAAVSLSHVNDIEKALVLIEKTISKVESERNENFLGAVYLTKAEINKKRGEIELAIEDADDALDHFRDVADWRGMAWAYYHLGTLSLAQGLAKKSLDYFNLAVQMVGENSEPVVLGRVFADMAGSHWVQNDAKSAVECLEKALDFFRQTENELQQLFAYNDLGVSLMLLGDWLRAEKSISKSLEIAKKLEHPHTPGIYDSLGELKLLKCEFAEAADHLDTGVNLSKEQANDLYLVQNLKSLARVKLAEENFDEAISIAENALKTAEGLGETPLDNLIRLVFAESFLGLGELAKAEIWLDKIDEDDPESDFFVFGNLQRLRGLIAFKNDDEKTALNFLRRSLTIFETRGDVYHKALLHSALGDLYAEKNAKTAAEHYVNSSEIFRKLGVKKIYNNLEKKIRELEQPRKKGDADEESDETQHVNTQLLMQRLAEATASRELLFRELVAILQQESKAGRMLIAEPGETGKFQPTLVHGYTPVESNQLAKELDAAILGDNLRLFAKEINASIYHLKPPNAPPAALLIFPKYTAKLENGGKIEPLLGIVELGMDVCALREKDGDDRVAEEKNPFISQSVMPGFIHSSPAMTKLVEEVYKLRSSDVTVLVTGESGTGKELVSRAIHAVSDRKEKVFVPFNCTAVPKELTEGHLFGYKRGAFTGAANDSPGMIKTADGGTLLLDEIGDLPIDVQPKLLRFLQEGEIQPLGEKRPFNVDVRIIAATNMDLEEKVKQGLFREDLFYRINVVRLRVPPLRERRSEIKQMVMYYINHYSARFNKKDITIKPQTIDLLMVSDWEGNVRQLCNEVQRIVARAHDGEVITPDHISPELKKTPVQKTFDESGNVKPLISGGNTPGMFTVGTEGTTIEEAVSELETQMIIDAMRRNDGNITRVSKELGLTRRGLYMKIDRYGIKRAS